LIIDVTKQTPKKRWINDRSDSPMPFQKSKDDLLPFPRTKYDPMKLVIKKEPMIRNEGLTKPRQNLMKAKIDMETDLGKDQEIDYFEE
jgi:hypothetical protein